MEKDKNQELNYASEQNGWKGLLLVGGVVALWDFSKNETITAFVERQVYHDRLINRVAALGAIAYVGAHLCDKIPTQWDGFDMTARGASRLRERIDEWTTRGVHIP